MRGEKIQRGWYADWKFSEELSKIRVEINGIRLKTSFIDKDKGKYRGAIYNESIHK